MDVEKAIVIYFYVLFQNLSEGREENGYKLQELGEDYIIMSFITCAHHCYGDQIKYIMWAQHVSCMGHKKCIQHFGRKI